MTTLPPPDLPVNSGGNKVAGPPPIYDPSTDPNLPIAPAFSSSSPPPKLAEGSSVSKSPSSNLSDNDAPADADSPVPLSITPSRFTGSTAFLISFIAHVLLLLLLAVVLLQPEFVGQSGVSIDAVFDRTEKAELEVLPNDRSLEEGTNQSEVDSSATSTELVASETAAPTSPLEQKAQPQTSMAQLLASSASEAVVEAFRNSSVSQRQSDQRAAAAAANGGTRESEAAVENGLKWLMAHQSGDGSWSLQYRTPECAAGCDHEGREGDYQPAATGLALLSFLGAGYSHREGPYQAELRKAIYYLITRIEYDESGEVGNLAGISEHAMYNHGIATLALCEAYQMSNDSDLEKPVRALIQYTVNAQHDVGGWGYSAATPGDLTISAWQVMSIKSAHSAGIRVPSDVMRRFDRFMDTQQSGAGAFYGYRGPGKQAGTTAMGLLLRMYRGWFRSDPRLLEGLNYLEKTGVSTTDVYFNFYATQVFFHQDGPAWTKWNQEVRDFLVKSQAQRGHEAGSWSMIDSYSKVGGRLYCTCMSILTLEVYYRYPPMFREITRDSFEF
jgi:hypothetical protein